FQSNAPIRAAVKAIRARSSLSWNDWWTLCRSRFCRVSPSTWLRSEASSAEGSPGRSVIISFQDFAEVPGREAGAKRVPPRWGHSETAASGGQAGHGDHVVIVVRASRLHLGSRDGRTTNQDVS